MIPATILILEDTPETMVWLTNVTLAAFPDATITGATNLADAIEIVRHQSFDLALVDLGLPDGSGITLIDEVRNLKQDTFLVVATIYDDERSLFDALRAGANGYLLKDEPKETILKYLLGVLENHAPVSKNSMEMVLNHFHKQGESRRESDLSVREEEVLRLIAKGLSVVEAAGLLELQANTVKGYVKTIYSKLGISTRAEATSYAIQRNLIDI